MRYLKNHLSLIFALVVIFITVWTNYSMFLMINRYEIKLADNYVIIASFKNNLNIVNFKTRIKDVDRVELISSKKIVNNYKNILSKKETRALSNMLPHFYKIYMKKYPTPREVNLITKKIEIYKDVVNVESFRQSHNKIYDILIIIKRVINIFTIFLVVLSFLIFKKEISLWKFEHVERLKIMSLLGAGSFMKFSGILKITIIDTFLSVIITSIIFFVVEHSSAKENISDILGINVLIFNPFYILVLFTAGIVISFIMSISIMNSSKNSL